MANDLFSRDSLAEQHPDISFLHMYPGGARTPMVSTTSSWWKPLYPLVLGLVYPVSKSTGELGAAHI